MKVLLTMLLSLFVAFSSFAADSTVCDPDTPHSCE